MPSAASSMPVGTSGLGPKRGSSSAFELVEVMMIITTIGRKARPVVTGL